MKKDGDFHLQLYSSSPAPIRDYHGLTVTSTHVTLNSWDISHGPHVYPRRRRLSLENVNLDRGFCSELQVIFGRHVLDYIHRVVRGDASLYTVPEKVFRKILSFLAAGDVVRVGQTSKIFFQMCNTNAIWKIIFQKKLGRQPTKSELDISEVMSWKYMIQRRVLEKRENKKIYENFKHGVENLQRQTKKEAEKIRKNSTNSETLIHERKPPEDKFKTKKIPVKTFKIGEENNKEKPSANKQSTTSGKSVKNNCEKPHNLTRKSNDSERKVENDLRTKSSSQLLRKSTSTCKEKTADKNLAKLNKNAKDIKNLKSKSVFM